MPLVITPMHDESDGWKHIDGGGFYAQAKIHDTPSQHGLLGGRISKLTIWHSEDDPNPLYEIFNTAGEVMKRLKSAGKGHGNNRDILVQRLTQTREEEIYKLEQYTPFLATTASTAPFVGLFGTVWGILTAFWNIGKEGSSTLAVVGPYIAEALIATAIGLAAAIPAVIFYNFYVNRVRLLSKDLQDFSTDLASRIDREYLNG